MAETKTKPTTVSVAEFLAQLDNPHKLAEAHILIDMMSRATGKQPKMWGPSIIGFGSYHYVYASGHAGDAPLAAFSPRKAEFSIYLSPEQDKARSALLAKLGKHRMGKGCLYVKRLEQIDLSVLGQLVRQSVDATKASYATR